MKKNLYYFYMFSILLLLISACDDLETTQHNLSGEYLISTLAGSGISGYSDGMGSAAKFYSPKGLTIDAQGNIYVADRDNHKIRKISTHGVVSTLAGSTWGDSDGTGSAAQFVGPDGLTIDSQGNLYVVDNHKIRKISPQGVVTTLAGSIEGYIDGIVSVAQFDYPSDVCTDAQGNIYVADSENHKIRKISITGYVTTLAGSSVGYADGSGNVAKFNLPTGLAIDANGNIYVADTKNQKIRKISPNGDVSTIAGTTKGYTDGPGNVAQFYHPHGIALDADGNVLVADIYNFCIRKVSPEGIVSTIAGGYADSTNSSAGFSSLTRLAIDAKGNIYVADTENHRILKLTPR